MSVGAVGLAVTVVAGCGGGSPSQSASTTASTPEPVATQAAASPTPGADQGGGAKSVSFGERLRSARIADENLDDKDQEFAEFCFREPIQEIEDGGKGFAVQGPDGKERTAATTVRIAEDDNNCALVGFPSGTDLRAYTLGVASASAINDNDGDGNVQDSVGLSGARDDGGPGRTSGPDLVDVSTQKSLNRIQYHFDEQLDENAAPSADKFGFYSATGDSHKGTEVTSVEGETVTVKFDEGADAQVENSRRAYVDQGAVKDGGGTENPQNASGGRTAAPDLVEVDRVKGTDSQFDFRFDEAVTSGEAKGFVVYADDGTPYTARDTSSESSPLVVRATFPEEVEDFPGSLVDATAGDGATRDGDDNPSTLGGQAVGRGGVKPGRTNGPDLLSVEYGTSSDQATFTFDEPLDDDGPMKADGFSVVTRDDEVTPAEEVVEVNGRTAVVRFSEDALKAARGAIVGDAAVHDFQGTPNPPHAVAVNG